jgi:hypothetical protein
MHAANAIAHDQVSSREECWEGNLMIDVMVGAGPDDSIGTPTEENRSRGLRC